MKLATLSGLSLAALSILILSAGNAQAQFVFGTFGFGPVAAVTVTPGSNLLTATDIILPANERVNITGSGDFSQQGTFALTTGQHISLGGDPGTTDFTIGSLYPGTVLTFTAGGETFHYEELAIKWTSTPGLKGGGSISFNSEGVFSADLPGTTFQISRFSGSFTQASKTSAINASFMFNAIVPMDAVPEPDIALLLPAMGLGGFFTLGLRHRRQRRMVSLKHG